VRLLDAWPCGGKNDFGQPTIQLSEPKSRICTYEHATTQISSKTCLLVVGSGRIFYHWNLGGLILSVQNETQLGQTCIGWMNLLEGLLSKSGTRSSNITTTP